MNKNALLALLAAALLMVLTNCKKNPDITVEQFEITSENVSVQANSATIAGVFSFSGTVESISVLVAENEALNQAKSYEATIEGSSFSAVIGDLKANTTYHYCYSVDLGLSSPFNTEKKSFVTFGHLPTVLVTEILPIDNTTFRIKCEVVSDGGQEVTERGICWNTYGNPDLDDETAQHGEAGVGEYSIRMGGLALNTKYYVRAYAKNNAGINYSETRELETGMDATLPIVSMLNVSDISYASVLCHGEVVSNGGMELTERGVCWGLEPEPSVNVHHIVAEGTETGAFTVVIEGLLPNTTYHVRSYAVNEKGTAYSEEDLTFNTTEGKPVVTTSNATDITSSSAKVGGNVTDEGASPVTERGVCWSTENPPTLLDQTMYCGAGGGAFETVLDNLDYATTYFVCAFAINAQGLTYGECSSFNTEAALPTVETIALYSPTQTTVECRGNVSSDGGASVTEKGFCWSTSQNPTLDGFHIIAGIDIGYFTTTIENLTPNTKYYVRAYATNSVGTAYGDEKDFTSLNDIAPNGAINGLFSVSENSQVYFSKGNLQYNGGWKFAENQWDVIGGAQGDDSPQTPRDLFGWGTSSNNHGAVCYQPWSTSTNSSDYYAYGDPTLNLHDGIGNADWGYNAINNGGNQSTSGWRTLTKEEWDYLFNHRHTSSGKLFAKARVNGVNGVVLLPDSWNNSGTLHHANEIDADYATNTIDEPTWATNFEENGAVFLPAGGNRNGTTINSVNDFGRYWSASHGDDNSSKELYFSSGTINTDKNGRRHFGLSVRLVIPAQ